MKLYRRPGRKCHILRGHRYLCGKGAIYPPYPSLLEGTAEDVTCGHCRAEAEIDPPPTSSPAWKPRWPGGAPPTQS